MQLNHHRSRDQKKRNRVRASSIVFTTYIRTLISSFNTIAPLTTYTHTSSELLLSGSFLLFPFAWPQQNSLCPSCHWPDSTLLMSLATIPLQTSLFHMTTALKWSGTFSAHSLPMPYSCYSTLTWELGTGLSQITRLLSENGLSCMLIASSRKAMDWCICFWTAMTQSHSLKASKELTFALVSPLSRMPISWNWSIVMCLLQMRNGMRRCLLFQVWSLRISIHWRSSRWARLKERQWEHLQYNSVM